MTTYKLGTILPNGATVTADDMVTNADGSTVETIIATYPVGSFDTEVIYTPPPDFVPPPTLDDALQQIADLKANVQAIADATATPLPVPIDPAPIDVPAPIQKVGP